MKLTDLVNSRNGKKGRVRVIDENGKVIRDHQTDGISIDFIDARWCIKQGEILAPKTYQAQHLNLNNPLMVNTFFS